LLEGFGIGSAVWRRVAQFLLSSASPSEFTQFVFKKGGVLQAQALSRTRLSCSRMNARAFTQRSPTLPVRELPPWFGGLESP
jgi:hypothetical protein